MAVFGASPEAVDGSVGSVCSALKVPYLTASSVANTARSKFVVEMGPKSEHLVEAVVEVVEKMGWKEVAVVAHRSSGE